MKEKEVLRIFNKTLEYANLDKNEVFLKNDILLNTKNNKENIYLEDEYIKVSEFEKSNNDHIYILSTDYNVFLTLNDEEIYKHFFNALSFIKTTYLASKGFYQGLTYFTLLKIAGFNDDNNLLNDYHAAFALKLIALIIAILFILSSLLNTIVIKERKGDVVFKSSYKDTFKILKNNKYELPALFILFLFFAAVFILLGNSVNLFYYTYGYGNEAIYGSPLSSGGFTGVSFIFSLVYGVAITISQFLYPYINRKFSRKQILTFSVFAITVLYLLIYFFLSNRANVYLFFVAIFILAFFQGQINSIIIMHNTLVPYLSTSEEPKTKPTQHSVKELTALGIQPDAILLRTEIDLDKDTISKVGLFCNVNDDAVITVKDVKIIYEVALNLEKQHLDDLIVNHLVLSCKPVAEMDDWRKFVKRVQGIKEELNIALVGKYTQLHGRGR